MKAIIPVAGVGSRLRPHTHTQPKALVPVAGKPILLHIVDMLVDNGVENLVFIIGYMGTKIRQTVKEYYQGRNLNIEFIVQDPREGIGHALYIARHTFEKEEEILIVLGDTIVNIDLERLKATPDSVLGVQKVSDPGRFGIAEIRADGRIRRLVEKPQIPKSNLALVGIYKIADPALLTQALEQIIENGTKHLGEYQLTDALMYMVEQGHPMRTEQVDSWFDCGKRSSLLEANAILLSQQMQQAMPEYKFPSTIIIPPVSIGSNCKITHSIIGPNVAIGDDTVVSYSIIEDTIVGSYSELRNIMLCHSIIGNDTRILGLSQQLNIGDNTEINFTEG
jgi:glucose-1-phosphate thymidylyltransferase